MFRLGVIAAFLTCAVVGCRQYDVTMTDPDGNQVVTSSMNASLRDVTWLGIPIVLLILSLAAFLHWRRNGLWFLAILAFAAALMAVGLIAGRAGEWRMWGASMDDIASGHRAPIQWLMSTQQWLVAFGYVLAAIGGLGAVALAIQRKT